MNRTKKIIESILRTQFLTQAVYPNFNMSHYIDGQVFDAVVSSFLEVKYICYERHNLFLKI